jgi:hypothetical protein
LDDEPESCGDSKGRTIPVRVVVSISVVVDSGEVVLISLDDNISDMVDADVTLVDRFESVFKNESIPKTIILFLSIGNMFVSPDFKAFNITFDSTLIELDNFS